MKREAKMTDKKPGADNFDKEFRLNSDKKAAVRGKIPSWIMILAGIAVIAAVVIVKQPFVRPSESGTKASLTVPGAGGTVTGQTAGFNGMNDQQADSSELEARFGEQGSVKEEFTPDYSVVLAGSS